MESAQFGINISFQIESDIDSSAIFERGLTPPNSSGVLFDPRNVQISFGFDLSLSLIFVEFVRARESTTRTFLVRKLERRDRRVRWIDAAGKARTCGIEPAARSARAEWCSRPSRLQRRKGSEGRRLRTLRLGKYWRSN